MPSSISSEVHLKEPVQQNSMVALREAFAEFDQNSDGYISKEELGEVMKNFGHLATNEELESMIKYADKEGNGLVDFKEFLNLMEYNCLVDDPEKEIRSLFDMIDSNHDGYLEE